MLLHHLGRRGILQVLVEGGSILQASMLQDGLVDALALYRGACVLGNDARDWVGGRLMDKNGSGKSISIESALETQKWELEMTEALGNDVFTLHYAPLDRLLRCERPFFDSVSTAINTIREGGMVVVMDNEDREVRICLVSSHQSVSQSVCSVSVSNLRVLYVCLSVTEQS